MEDKEIQFLKEIIIRISALEQLLIVKDLITQKELDFSRLSVMKMLEDKLKGE